MNLFNKFGTYSAGRRDNTSALVFPKEVQEFGGFWERIIDWVWFYLVVNKTKM